MSEWVGIYFMWVRYEYRLHSRCGEGGKCGEKKRSFRANAITQNFVDSMCSITTNV